MPENTGETRDLLGGKYFTMLNYCGASKEFRKSWEVTKAERYRCLMLNFNLGKKKYRCSERK